MTCAQTVNCVLKAADPGRSMECLPCWAWAACCLHGPRFELCAWRSRQSSAIALRLRQPATTSSSQQDGRRHQAHQAGHQAGHSPAHSRSPAASPCPSPAPAGCSGPQQPPSGEPEALPAACCVALNCRQLQPAAAAQQGCDWDAPLSTVRYLGRNLPTLCGCRRPLAIHLRARRACGRRGRGGW